MTRVAVAMLAAAVLPMVGAPPGGAQDEPTPPTPPNVLIIVTDDQPVGTMSVMPSTRAWFGGGGRSYRNAFVTTPTCCPSRAAIMTGRFAHNNGVRTNLDAHALQQDVTLQAYLQGNGYATAMSGKYLNSWDERTEPPPAFDRFSAISDHNYHLVYNGYDVNEDGVLQEDMTEYSTHYIRDRATEYLHDFEGNDEQPWFMYVAPFAPHEPFTAAEHDAGAAVPRWGRGPNVGEANRTDKPWWVRKQRVDVSSAASRRAAQLRSLIAVDDLVETVMSEVEVLDEQDTLAFFVSDNGYLWAHHYLSGKRHPYTPSIKVPFFARWPGHLPPGRDGRLTQLIDIAPTVLEAAGIEPSIPMDGRSLLSDNSRRRMFMEFGGSRGVPPWIALRTRRYQYVVYLDHDGRSRYREYYDLVEDPYQLKNLLGDWRRKNDPPLYRIRQRLREARRCVGSACP